MTIEIDRCPICSIPGGGPESHRGAHVADADGGEPETVAVPAPVVLMPGREVPVASLARGGRGQTPGGIADLALAHGWQVRASVALAGVHELKRVKIEGMAEVEQDGKLKAGQRKTRDVVTPMALESVVLWMCREGARAWAGWSNGAFDTAGWIAVDSLAGAVGVLALRGYLAGGDSGTVAA